MVRIVAYSFGCQIAYRMASDLEKAGLRVQLLLLDGRLPALGDGHADEEPSADDVMAILRGEITLGDPCLFSDSERQSLRRLGELLGDEGCVLADRLLRLNDERPGDVPAIQGRVLFVGTAEIRLKSGIADTRLLACNHYELLSEREVHACAEDFFR